jgi:hypothetical protein
MEFVHLLREATHENSGLPESVIEQLYAPLEEAFTLDDPNHLQSVRLFLASSSREDYIQSCYAVTARDGHQLLSWDQVHRKLASWTGVHLVRHDMCIKACIGFTGPYEELDHCPKCGQSRYDEIKLAASHGRIKQPRLQFFTLPLGPQVQARWAERSRAHAMKYAFRKLRENLRTAAANGGAMPKFDDILSGIDLLEAFRTRKIRDGDTLLFYSGDGAQIYRNKKSGCWFSVGVLLNLEPGIRYTKTEVIPLSIVPCGDNHPVDWDSFNYPVFHHFAALMRQGLNCYDAELAVVFRSNLHVCMCGADGPGLTTLDGGVGKSGKAGCRLHCPFKGRRKPGGSHYYFALQRPDDYAVPGCSHDDIDPADIAAWVPSQREYMKNLAKLLRARNRADYERLRLETGLVKPSLLLGLPVDRTFGIPGTFGSDFMHLPALNTPDLLYGLWHGTIDHDRRDFQRQSEWPWAELSRPEIWREYGAKADVAAPYWPGWYDRIPRNPAEKMNSGYKAWEFLLLLFGLGPKDLRAHLPEEYWVHFCKLTRVFDILGSHIITVEELNEAEELTQSLHTDFEDLYCKRNVGRLHFVRILFHTLLHVPMEVRLKGPTSYYSQWTIERVIGLLKDDLRLHSDPFSNLAHIAMRLAQTNALRSLVPDLMKHKPTLQEIGHDLGDGYVSLHPREDRRRRVRDAEFAQIHAFMNDRGLQGDFDWVEGHSVLRFGRLAVPNGSLVRTAWRENLKALEDLRTSRMAEVSSQ